MRTRSQSMRESSSPVENNNTTRDLDDFDIDELLSLAKKNLVEQKNTHLEPEDTIEENSDHLATAFQESQGPSETFKQIQKSWKQLPKLNPGLDDIETVNLSAKSKKVVKLVADPKATSSISLSTSTFRKIADPVKIAKQEKEERQNNAGDKWFNMPKQELTPQLKRDLQLLKMRNVLDPKRHYRKDNSPLPTYFQTGTIVEGNTEYYSARISRKDRRTTIADEILSDVSSKAYFKRKYSEIQSSKTSGKKAFYKKLKSMRKKL